MTEHVRCAVCTSGDCQPTLHPDLFGLVEIEGERFRVEPALHPPTFTAKPMRRNRPTGDLAGGPGWRRRQEAEQRIMWKRWNRATGRDQATTPR